MSNLFCEIALNDDTIPLTCVLLKDETPIAVISLKEKEREEFQEFHDGSPWIGSLQVIEGERNQGIGGQMLTFVKMLAARLGYKNIFLYTSNQKAIEWYRKRGVLPIAMQNFQGHQAAVMKIALDC